LRLANTLLEKLSCSFHQTLAPRRLYSRTVVGVATSCRLLFRRYSFRIVAESTVFQTHKFFWFAFVFLSKCRHGSSSRRGSLSSKIVPVYHTPAILLLTVCSLRYWQACKINQSEDCIQPYAPVSKVPKLLKERNSTKNQKQISYHRGNIAYLIYNDQPLNAVREKSLFLWESYERHDQIFIPMLRVIKPKA
jgi:hypothetical protein